jgi:hypothetical protein
LLARATALLLATGTLDHAVDCIAHEAELAANTSGSAPSELAPVPCVATGGMRGAAVAS